MAPPWMDRMDCDAANLCDAASSLKAGVTPDGRAGCEFLRRHKKRHGDTSSQPPQGGEHMRAGAQPALPPAAGRRTAAITPIRSIALDDAEDDARAALLRRMACERLRDLRDDGMTVGYMARMYGVEPGMMEEMMSALGLGPR
jgi:hypothetical protein